VTIAAGRYKQMTASQKKVTFPWRLCELNLARDTAAQTLTAGQSAIF
jgi:hypothetical protein